LLQLLNLLNDFLHGHQRRILNAVGDITRTDCLDDEQSPSAISTRLAAERLSENISGIWIRQVLLNLNCGSAEFHWQIMRGRPFGAARINEDHSLCGQITKVFRQMLDRKMKRQVALDRLFVVTSCPYDGENLVMANFRCRDFVIVTGVNSSLAENRGGHPMGAQQLRDKQTVHGGEVSACVKW
jgi:hypothetical protein